VRHRKRLNCVQEVALVAPERRTLYRIYSVKQMNLQAAEVAMLRW
jgi:hypothetical protein